MIGTIVGKEDIIIHLLIDLIKIDIENQIGIIEGIEEGKIYKINLNLIGEIIIGIEI